MTSQLPIVWRRHAFGPPLRELRPAGGSVADIVRSLPMLPARFWADGVVLVGDVIVPREMWHHVRPKPALDGSVDVALWLAPQGDGIGQVLSLVATIAIIAGAALISGGLLAGPFAGGVLAGGGLGGLFAAGSISATVAASVFTLGAALAVQALSPQPSTAALAPASNDTGRSLTPASLQGNVLRPGAPIPHVRGVRKIYPPIVVKPLVELIGNDEYVTGVIGLAGPHSLTDIRAGGAPLSAITEVEYETREGHSSDSILTLVTRQSKTDPSALELSKHTIDVDNPQNLEDQTTPLNSVPQWHRMRATGSPDEIWINLLWPQGLFDQDNPSTDMIVPVRVRLREKSSSTWINLPEVIFCYDKQEAFQKDIRIIFETAPALPTPELLRCPYAAVVYVEHAAETTIGNFTNTSRAFNGSTLSSTSSATRNSTDGYIGVDYGSYPRSLSTVILWPDSSTGFWSGGAATAITFNVRGKNGTAPASKSDGTLLATLTLGADTTTPQVLTSTDPVTEWRYQWVEALPNAVTTMAFREVQFAGENDWSWIANSHFWSTLTASHNMRNSNIGSTPVRNIALYADRAEIFLPTGTFPLGDYDIEVKRGAVQQKSNWDVVDYNNTDAGHQNSSSDLFNWINQTSTFQVERSTAGLYDKMVRQRLSLVWNTHPLTEAPGNLALIAFKAKNRQLGQVSVLASRYLLDYDSGAGTWSTLTTSTNPASHARDVFAGGLNADPVPDDLIDASFVTFRTHSIDSGYEVNAVFEGEAAAVVAQVCAASGYGRIRQSETFGVIIDKDRTAESVVQTFTSRNARGYAWDKAYVRLPSGLRCIYADADNDYQETELIVLDPDGDQAARYEEARYDGLVTAAEVTARALYDMAYFRLRGTRHSFESNQQAIKCKAGDLVGLNHPILTAQMGAAYVRSIVTSGTDIVALTLDGTVPTLGSDGFFSGPDGFIDDLYGDLFFGPVDIGAVVRLETGDELTAEIEASGVAVGSRTITFAAPQAGPVAGLAVGCLVATGRLGSERLRLIVGEIAPKDGPQFPATIVAVDEAPELWA